MCLYQDISDTQQPGLEPGLSCICCCVSFWFVCFLVLLSGEERRHLNCFFFFCMLFISLPGDGPQNISHVVFLPLGSLLSSKQSIFKCSHGAPLYTTGHPVGMDPKQIKWSKAWVEQLLWCRRKNHLVSRGVEDPAKKQWSQSPWWCLF